LTYDFDTQEKRLDGGLAVNAVVDFSIYISCKGCFPLTKLSKFSELSIRAGLSTGFQSSYVESSKEHGNIHNLISNDASSHLYDDGQGDQKTNH
jgi:hypothetical protein